MTEPEINIRTDPQPVGRRRASFRTRKVSPVVLLVSAVVCAAIAAIIFAAARTSAPDRQERPTPGELPLQDSLGSPRSATPTAAKPQGVEDVVEDAKGELLWASPTTGAPLSLAYVPAGTQCLVHLRFAELAAHPEGPRIRAALGPWGQRTVEQLEALLGSELGGVESLLASVVVDADGKLDACLRAGLSSPLTEQQLAARLRNAKQARHSDTSYYVVGDRAYFQSEIATPEAASASWLVVCPTTMAVELLDSSGEPPPLVRDIERLASSSDADRLLTMIVSPKFLQASGNKLLAAEAAPLHGALKRLVGDDATALLLSAHLADDFFAEIRATPTLNVSPRRLAIALHERIAAAPDAIEAIVLAEAWHAYGRKVIARLPGMLRSLSRYSRAGEDDRQAVVRAYLPASAGHNLLMAGELLLTQPHAADALVEADEGTEQPATIDQRLARTTSLTFAKETLERALELLAEDVGVEISISGADLQLEGITKNQSLELDIRDRPAREILLEILLRANPDRTATDPADPRQKLIYVMEASDQQGDGRIIVTTRAAAERRGDGVPAVFLPRNL